MEAIEDLLTNETIFEVLRWNEGSFHFSAQAVKHDKPPEKLLGAEQILMDGLRMVDEWQNLGRIVPSMDTVFEHRRSFEEYGEAVRYLLSVPTARLEEFERKLANLTRGEARMG